VRELSTLRLRGMNVGQDQEPVSDEEIEAAKQEFDEPYK
jgi:hypothetical protein